MRENEKVTEQFAGCATIEELASSVSEELFTQFSKLTQAGSKATVSEAVNSYVSDPNNTWMDHEALANLMNACAIVRTVAIPEEYVDKPVGDYMANSGYMLIEAFM
tara:strand:+ start:3653 stop:3970 length:318 start_codon:yes stop_codon:yes gene_type:complete